MSAHKRQVFVLAVAVLLLVSFLIAQNLLNELDEAPLVGKQQTVGRIGDAHFNFEIVDEEESRRQGLSERESLLDTDAMLFVFDNPGKHCIWMKGMKFSLDIAWFAEDKKLINLEKDIAPDTYPENFCPDKPALYVVELSAGTAETNDIGSGSVLEIDL